MPPPLIQNIRLLYKKIKSVVSVIKRCNYFWMAGSHLLLSEISHTTPRLVRIWFPHFTGWPHKQTHVDLWARGHHVQKWCKAPANIPSPGKLMACGTAEVPGSLLLKVYHPTPPDTRQPWTGSCFPQSCFTSPHPRGFVYSGWRQKGMVSEMPLKHCQLKYGVPNYVFSNSQYLGHFLMDLHDLNGIFYRISRGISVFRYRNPTLPSYGFLAISSCSFCCVKLVYDNNIEEMSRSFCTMVVFEVDINKNNYVYSNMI